jgi:DNA polymerase-3 subunit delta
MAAGNVERSLEIMHVLLDSKESAVSIFAGLVWCWHKLRDYTELLAQGGVNEFELRKIGLSSPKVREDYVNAARLFDSAAATRCIALAAETDVRIRSGGASVERLLLELYVYQVLVKVAVR